MSPMIFLSSFSRAVRHIPAPLLSGTVRSILLALGINEVALRLMAAASTGTDPILVEWDTVCDAYPKGS